MFLGAIMPPSTLMSSYTKFQRWRYNPLAKDYDFVSRYFAPEEGTNVSEDPVTGSTHAVLVPLWAERLGKNRLHAYQASERGGELFCELRETNGIKRALIGGHVQPYLQGFINLNNS